MHFPLRPSITTQWKHMAPGMIKKKACGCQDQGVASYGVWKAGAAGACSFQVDEEPVAGIWEHAPKRGRSQQCRQSGTPHYASCSTHIRILQSVLTSLAPGTNYTCICHCKSTAPMQSENGNPQTRCNGIMKDGQQHVCHSEWRHGRDQSTAREQP